MRKNGRIKKYFKNTITVLLISLMLLGIFGFTKPTTAYADSSDNKGSSNKVEPNYIAPLYWKCTRWKSGGGYLAPGCTAVLGLTIPAVKQKWPIPPWLELVAKGGIIVFCYVPRYTICVGGIWTKVHPI